MNAPQLSTLWMDVDDILHYLAHHSRPSGIQRVSFEICRALHRLDGGAGRVRFVRRGSGPRDVVTVHWDYLEAAFDLVANPRDEAAPRRSIGTGSPPVFVAPSEGTGKQQILMTALAAEAQALCTLARLPVLLGTKAAVSVQRRLRGQNRRKLTMSEGVPLEDAAAPGDSLVVLGSPWHRRDYVQSVRWMRDELRMRFALLIHDLIPDAGRNGATPIWSALLFVGTCRCCRSPTRSSPTAAPRQTMSWPGRKRLG